MPNFREVYINLKKHVEKTTGNTLSFDENEFTQYMNRIGQRNEMVNNMSQADREIHNIIFQQLVNNQTATKDLVNKIPAVQKQKDEYLKKLREDAANYARADMKKKEAAQINERRKAARIELERIRKENVKNKAKEENREATAEELATPKLHEVDMSGRGRNILRSAMNYCGLGPHDDRRGLDSNGRKRPELLYANKPGALPIEHKSKDGKIKLTGGMYQPKNPQNPPKVVVVFSGSHGPGSEYIDDIKDAYLANGVTVVQLDYRGFGSSTNLDQNGQPTNNYLSERTMYEDGMEMYRYVNEELGFNPENITLHGYSIGAAVASRVALETTKKLENERILSGEPKDPTKGIGGVVLHSPIKSMYEAGKADYWIPGGFFGWAGSGAYNTKEHMLELAKVDNSIPVHMIGGEPDENSNDYDHLSPEATGLSDDLQDKFTNISRTIGEGDHFGKTFLGYQKNNEGKYVLDQKGKKIAMFESQPNVTASDPYLNQIVTKGRDINRTRVNQLEHQAGGPGIA